MAAERGAAPSSSSPPFAAGNLEEANRDDGVGGPSTGLDSAESSVGVLLRDGTAWSPGGLPP